MNTNIAPPRVSKVDEHFEAKQAVRLYGDKITPAQVQATLDTVDRLQLAECGDNGGPIAQKHYKRGFDYAVWMSVRLILESLVQEGQPFETLRPNLTQSARGEHALYALRHLRDAIDNGLWN